MSSDYSLRCPKHEVDCRTSDGEELIEHNGSSGNRLVRWAAEAGWLITEAMRLDGGSCAFVRGPHDQCAEVLCAFAHEHAHCGGIDVMRDQGGGRVPDERVIPVVYQKPEGV